MICSLLPDHWEAMSVQEPPPIRKPMSDEELGAVTVGEPASVNGPIRLVDYEPNWPDLYRREAVRIRDALGDRGLQIEHVGSTAVQGLAAKPIIDIVLVVVDSSDESSYLPHLEAVGYVLRIREPDWYEHRVFQESERDVNLHVFSAECPEVDRMALLRDWLRANEIDRELYERAKRHLARQHWKFVQNYADAKTEVVEAILERARQEEV